MNQAVKSYPSHLIENWQLADGIRITIRPIRPDDATIEQAFVRNLSTTAKYFRFMQCIHELTPEMLVRFTHIDYINQLALIAVVHRAGTDTQIGVTRYFVNPDEESCEFALVISDLWQQRGIGSKLTMCLMEAARSHGLKTMEAEVLATNTKMLSLAVKLGFSIRSGDDAFTYRIMKSL